MHASAAPAPAALAAAPAPAAGRLGPMAAVAAAAAGIVAGTLFWVWFVEPEALRHLIAHLTAVPLFAIGFLAGPAAMLLAAVSACATVALARADITYGLVYGLLIAAPAWWLVWRSGDHTLHPGAASRPTASSFTPVFYQLLAWYAALILVTAAAMEATFPHGAAAWLLAQVYGYLEPVMGPTLGLAARQAMAGQANLVGPLAEALQAGRAAPQDLAFMVVQAQAQAAALVQLQVAEILAMVSRITASWFGPGSIVIGVVAIGLMNARVGQGLARRLARWRRQALPPQVSLDLLDVGLSRGLAVLFVVALGLGVFAGTLGALLGDGAHAVPRSAAQLMEAGLPLPADPQYRTVGFRLRMGALTVVWLLALPVMMASFALVHLALSGRGLRPGAILTAVAIAPVLPLVPGLALYAAGQPGVGIALCVLSGACLVALLLIGLADPFLDLRGRQRRRLANAGPAAATALPAAVSAPSRGPA